MTDRLPQRNLADYWPVFLVVACTAALFVGSTALAFYAGARGALQPCLAGRLDTLLVRSDSLVRGLHGGRTR